MSTQQKMIQIRTRKLGILIYDARLAAAKSIEECAKAIGVTPEQYQAFENGEQSPTLPELEALAYYLDRPLEHFWGREAVAGKVKGEPVSNVQQLNRLRQRLIATMLRMARSKLNLSLSELAAKTSLSEDYLKKVEQGEAATQLPELEVLAASLGMQIEDFFDTRGPVGIWRAERKKIQQFLELPTEMQDFVCMPVNRPYIELAAKLSQLDVEKLRAVAEGLLQITY